MSLLRERNAKVIQHVLKKSEEMRNLRESMMRSYGVDIQDPEKFPFMKENFSIRAFRDKMREADTASQYTAFLRAGTQNLINDGYGKAETTFEDWVTVRPSTMNTEIYATNQGLSFPREVGPSEPYPEVTAATLDGKLQNRKYGSMYVLEKELIDDDQTGTFQSQAGGMGEYMKLLAEVLCYAKLASVPNMRYADFQIPQSEVKPSGEVNGFPWSTGMLGGGKNRPATFSLINQAAIQSGMTGMKNQLNKQGLKIPSKGNRLLIGSVQAFDVKTLLNSAYYPTGAAASGVTGGAFAENPIRGIANVTESSFMPKNDGTFNGDSYAWYIVDDTKPFFVLQVREAAHVTQEAPDSGKSFELDQYRYKCTARMNADWIDPRFAWQGNDGSVVPV
jgi:phage major head subunit gpT-like protein